MENEQEKIKKLMHNELMRDAEKIIKEVDEDESLKGITLPEDMDEVLRFRIEQYEAMQADYEKLSEEEKAALRLGRELLFQKLNGSNTP